MTTYCVVVPQKLTAAATKKTGFPDASNTQRRSSIACVSINLARSPSHIHSLLCPPLNRLGTLYPSGIDRRRHIQLSLLSVIEVRAKWQ